MRIFHSPVTALLSAFLFIFAPAAMSHSGHDRSDAGQLTAMVEQAQLIILGKVTEVEYRVEYSDAKERLPVAYVTYGIEKAVRGARADGSLTLRFLGGPDGQGRFLSVSNTPQFMVGERDLLFVRGNGSEACPLVNCEDGRYRVFEGGVYNAHGVPVRAIVDMGTIARGATHEAFREFRYPSPSFDDLMKNPEAAALLEEKGMSREEASRRYASEAPKEIVVQAQIVRKGADATEDQEREGNTGKDAGAIRASDEPLQENPVAVEEFVARVDEIARKTGGKLRPIVSIDPEDAKALSFGEPKRPEGKLESYPDDESEEARQIRENDGNPVIKNSAKEKSS